MALVRRVRRDAYFRADARMQGREPIQLAADDVGLGADGAARERQDRFGGRTARGASERRESEMAGAAATSGVHALGVAAS
jgi:hypothetical protein